MRPTKTFGIRLLITITALLVLSSGVVRSASFDEGWVYKESVSAFAPMANQWRYYPVATDSVICESLYEANANSRAGCVARYKLQAWSATATPSGALESRSPWWVDSNHNHVSTSAGQNGLGFINVIAQMTPLQTNQASLDLTAATVSFRVKKDSLFAPKEASIRGGKTRKGHLYFWFETAPRLLTNCTPDPTIGEDCARRSDYILSDIEADPASLSDVPYQIDSWLTPDVWRRLAYQFTPTAKWTCLGRGENVKYECEPIQQALKSVMHFGFVVAPVCTAPSPGATGAFYLCPGNAPTAEANSNQGTIYLDDVKISEPVASSVAWTGLVEVSTTGRGNSVRKSSSAGADWNAGAVSAQSLASGAGSLEFTVGAAAMYGVIGLSNAAQNSTIYPVDYGFYLGEDRRLYSYESGVAYGYSGANEFYAAGDRFRVSVNASSKGTTITYLKNGVPLPSRYRADASGDFQKEVYLPIRYPLRVTSSVLTPGGGFDDVKLAAAPSDLAQDVKWMAVRGNLSIKSNSIEKLDIGGQASGATSKASIAAGDGYVQFAAGDTSTYKLLGLNNDDRSADYTDIAYALYLYAGTVYVFEKGTLKYTMPGTYSAGDQFRVAVEGRGGSSGPVVRYYRNYVPGIAPLYTSTVNPTYPLFADASLYSMGATLQDVVLAGANENTVWSPGNTIGVTASPGRLVKTAGPGWNAGGVSTRAILAGDGYLEFTVTEAKLAKRIGLSRRNAGHDYDDIDFQFSFPASVSHDEMAIEEYAQQQQVGPTRTFASYAAGDRFRIGIEGGRVTYRRNGVLLYRNPVPLKPSSYPLLVNTPMFETGAAFGNVTISGALGDSGY